MAKLSVITGLHQLPPAERWQRLIAPLAEELAYSGLGELPDLQSLRAEAVERGMLETAEVAVTLRNFDYGWPLVSRVREAAGIRPSAPVTPVRWREFNCDDYFNSPLAEQGYWDEPGQYWNIWPAERIYEDTDLQLLVIGGSGVGLIDWGFRRGLPGIWAYPIDGEFVPLAPTAQALLQGWLSGDISI